MKCVVIVLLSLTFWSADCLPTGAPVLACDGLKPTHEGTFPQQSASPYTIKVSGSSYTKGGTVQVTLTGGSTSFNGFILSAVSMDDGKTQVGEFKEAGIPASKGVQLGPCSSGSAKTAVTHTNPDDKNNLVITWYAPSDADLPSIKFQGSFAQSHDTYWINVFSSLVMYESPTTTTIQSTTTTTQSTTPTSSATMSTTTQPSNSSTTSAKPTKTTTHKPTVSTATTNLTSTTTTNMSSTTSTMTSTTPSMNNTTPMKSTITIPVTTTNAGNMTMPIKNMTTSSPHTMTTAMPSTTNLESTTPSTSSKLPEYVIAILCVLVIVILSLIGCLLFMKRCNGYRRLRELGRPARRDLELENPTEAIDE